MLYIYFVFILFFVCFYFCKMEIAFPYPPVSSHAVWEWVDHFWKECKVIILVASVARNVHS